MISDNDARSRPARNSKKTLLKYCACAWGLPTFVVVTCFALDYMDTVDIGYGKQESRCVVISLHKILYRGNNIAPYSRETGYDCLLQ